MESLNDLIHEAKLRTLWWALCIFAVSYFLTHTSKSMWMNVPMSILFVSGLRILVNKVEFQWKVQQPRSRTYLSHLEKKQLSLNDPRLSSLPPPAKWKRKIDSPPVEAAMGDFIDKILKDFVVDLWYSEITPDREFPEQIRTIIMDVLAEISGRVKAINLVDLLTRDLVDLIGDHLELFRRNQAAIGVDVMKTLSSEERDERLKFHLLNSKELHPALISPESEYKVLQQLMSAVLATVLRQREAQCPVIRSIARELLTCLVMQPIMNLASPGYINELIESLLLLLNDDGTKGMGNDLSTNVASHHHGHSVANDGGHNTLTASNKHPSLNQGTDMILAKMSDQGGTSLQYNTLHQESSQVRPADWARMLDVATQRRTEILMPENLENMWTKGRNYKRKENKIIKAGFQDLPAKSPATDNSLPNRKLGQETSASKRGKYEVAEGKSSLPPMHALGLNSLQNVGTTKRLESSQNPNKELSFVGELGVDKMKSTRDLASDGHKSLLKRSSSTSSLGIQPDKEGDSIISEFYNTEFERHNEGFRGKSSSDMIVRKEVPLVPKLRCRVVGAYFEKLGSTCFAVYSIAVTDVQNKTWFVKRRYRNFERLHRHLKDIPNYTLHLPPKRIFSSSTDDAFVHQRCIQLDKYLQDLLSIANVAEQHEVWDFFSISSKNYSFGKSPSVMKTLAVNVDDAVDDIVRQFKGVSDGLMRKVVGSPSLINEGSATSTTWNLSWNADEIDKSIPRQSTAESVLSSDNEEGEKNINFDHENIDREVAQDSGLHSDNALISKGYSSPINNHGEEASNLDFDRKHDVVEARVGNDVPATNFILIQDNLEDPVGVPPEWTPPNVSVPILNLVDKIFQLKKRGWIRRQVYWISKQILQLVMEDAIDDWLLRQIHWLRREETVAQGIRWVQDVLWPGGTFFLRVGSPQTISSDSDQKPSQTMSRSGGSNITKSESGSFKQELEAARRASDIKKLLFG
ncbi:Sorting nexin-16 [Spatholobus suberectus]|nr:Sorting nexin-16 [Spatholobus suberectus]